ncbi:hypothetical protein A1D23_12480 [Chelonobacter oris]|uniref:hypothetical protein n=1 Tax=Chelonobacter oris TaxID=505317 RepID=UPI00244D1297|nr:hypothetical protein [Chelonobacter oris]MDH3001334.1 hypothetical protein [Chelonobacter oris]
MEHTMARLNFDKLRVKRLGDKGYTSEQAEALADAFDDALTQSQSVLATKLDIEQLQNRLLYAIGASFAASTTILIAIISLVKFL